jgi:hypothetical protein
MDKKAGLLLVGSLGQIEDVESRLCVDDMGIEEDEMWALFERLGYHKNNY